MSAEVREILLRLDREAVAGDLFIHHTTGRRPSRSAFYSQLRAACESVGVFGIHPHSLRHTFGSRLGGRDVSVQKMKRLMGLQSVKMTLRYVHLDAESLRAAVELAAGQSSRFVPAGEGRNRSGELKHLRAAG